MSTTVTVQSLDVEYILGIFPVADDEIAVQLYTTDSCCGTKYADNYKIMKISKLEEIVGEHANGGIEDNTCIILSIGASYCYSHKNIEHNRLCKTIDYVHFLKTPKHQSIIDKITIKLQHIEKVDIYSMD